MVDVRAASLPADTQAIRQLWVEYLRWANDEMESRYGFRIHEVASAVEHDLAAVAKFQPPNGHLLVTVTGDDVFGVACLQRIGPRTAEVKRMFVRPSHRGGGAGRALLQALVGLAAADGYVSVRLDSPEFMTAAHGLYRSMGFAEVEAYPESEIPDEYKPHALFMELVLQAESPS